MKSPLIATLTGLALMAGGAAFSSDTASSDTAASGTAASGTAATDDAATAAAIQHFSQNNASPAAMPGTESQRIVTSDEAATSPESLVQFFTQDAPEDVTVAARRRQVDLDIKFDFDSSELSNEGTDQLDNAGLALKDPGLRERRFMLSGHTDDVGNPAYNRVLSKRRAESAKQYLVKKYGIDEDRLATAGFGSEHPKEEGSTDEARKRNRRVVLEMVE